MTLSALSFLASLQQLLHWYCLLCSLKPSSTSSWCKLFTTIYPRIVTVLQELGSVSVLSTCSFQASLQHLLHWYCLLCSLKPSSTSSWCKLFTTIHPRVVSVLQELGSVSVLSACSFCHYAIYTHSESCQFWDRNVEINWCGGMSVQSRIWWNLL